MRRQPIGDPRGDRIPLSIAAIRSRRLAIVGLGVITVGCRRYREDLDYEFRVEQTWPLDGSPDLEFVQFESVFWDLILSYPPWEDGGVTRPAEYAFYDPDFVLMDSLLEGLPRHLNPGGRCLLAYGHVPAIDRLLSRAEELGYEAKILDDRQLDSLPENFLPGMLIEIRPAASP